MKIKICGSIVWRKVPRIKLESIDDYNNLIDNLKNQGFKLTRLDSFTNKIRAYHAFQVMNYDNHIEVKVGYGYEDFRRYYINKTFEEIDEDKDKITGKEAYDYVDHLFKNNNDELTIYRAFSGQKYINEYKLIKNCVPIQISYILKTFKQRIINNCYKGDVSSAFPYQMTKSLPTLHDCITGEGILEPTEEYPFAFYVKSGHIKIYNELDTRNINKFYYDKYNDSYNDNITDEFTILCKKSEYSLKEEFEYMYKNRKEDSSQKMYMNACIGFFHKNTDPRLSHIAAVVIARSNQEMLNRVEKLNKEGNSILYIATDSIIWCGKPSSITTNEKTIGAFVDEGHGQFYGIQVGAYQFLKDDNELIVKCTYLKNTDDKYSIPFGKLPCPKYETKIVFDKTTHKLIKII